MLYSQNIITLLRTQRIITKAFVSSRAVMFSALLYKRARE